MKCIYCRHKYTTKGVKRCPDIPSRTCERCCIEGKTSHSCNLNCKNAIFPFIKTSPLSSSVVGWTPMGETRGTVDEFLPRAFHFVSCEVIQINQRLVDMYTLEISCQFVLRGNEKLISQIYGDEGWKLIHIKDVAKERGQKLDFLPVPSLVIFPGSYARVIPESVNLRIGNVNTPVLLNDRLEFIGLPDCYPPMTEKPKPATEKYSYILGKSTAFYTPFKLKEVYTISFRLEEVNFFYINSFLFPYRFVTVDNLKIEADDPIKVAVKRMRLVKGYKADFFPPKQEYEFLKHTSTSLMPPTPITPADPFRIQPIWGEFQNMKDVPQGQTLSLSIENYAALQTRMQIGVPKGKDILTRVQTTPSPLPVRIYEQLQKLPRYRDFLITFDIINFNKKNQGLEVVSEINGYTDRAISTIEVPAYGNGKKPSRIILNQCPRLKRGVLEKIVRATDATLTYKIFKRQGNKRILYEQNTTTVTLLPKDQMVWVVDDLKSGSRYDLSKMLGAWISPTDNKGLLDKIRGGARKYHPLGVLVGEQGNTTLEEKTLQIKALYDYLNKESGIGYVNQPFYFGIPGQRILTAEQIIKAKAGNCIDLVVLFASLMEGLGINPLILLMPNHAFMGWGNKHKTSEMGFLECTTLGRVNPTSGKKYTFEESFDLATQNYKEKFLYIGEEDYLPLHSVFLGSERGYIVDLEEVRKEGIFKS